MENNPFLQLDNQGPLVLAEENNCFLIDWLTVVFHGVDHDDIMSFLGLNDPSIPWRLESKFRNGYPVHYLWNGITISFGADDIKYYSDSVDKKGNIRLASDKVRNDMGVCLTMSGTGCRAFESYGTGDWFRLFRYIFHDPAIDAEFRKSFRSNLTRLDIAYDDHTGVLDIHQMELDVRDRNFKARSTYTERVLSDDVKNDIHGTTLYFGSKSSPVLIRIYDKAAERLYRDRHWIRVELQLRDERASVFAAMLLRDQHIGMTASGVLRNYLCFLSPSNDSNKSRWPLAPYWDRLLLDMSRISLWVSPGEEYNFAATEHWLYKQWGQALRVIDVLHGTDYLIQKFRDMYPVDQLSPKYKNVIQTVRLDPQAPAVAESLWDRYGVKCGLDVHQLDFLEDDEDLSLIFPRL